MENTATTSYLNRRTEVIFNRDESKIYLGTIVRDDENGILIRLDDGREFSGFECQYSPLPILEPTR